MSDLDSISRLDVGKAIHDIITTLNRDLGKNAGYFFIKELSRNIGSDYNSEIKDMGVDLSLLQLEHEVNEMEKRLLESRKIEE